MDEPGRGDGIRFASAVGRYPSGIFCVELSRFARAMSPLGRLFGRNLPSTGMGLFAHEHIR